MTYTAKDKSTHDGRPMEFYEFVGSLRTYRFTDQPKAETLGGQVYLPIQITRSNLDLTSIVDNQKQMNIALPADTSIAQDYGGKLTPTKLSFTLYRAYRGDNLLTEYRQRYQGEATRYGFDGHNFQIEFSNLLKAELDQPLREVYYQSICNHILYDERCKANKAANTFATTVVAFSDDAVQVVDDWYSDGELKVGTIVNVRTGEERMIFNNLVNVIDIGYPFVDIVIGDQVQLIRGCDHGATDCVTKFDNYVNYGGYLFLPYKNPFENGL